MGLLFTKLIAKIFGNKEVRVLILGLDNAGKTTILYKLYSPDKVMRTTPTIGFNMETVSHNNVKFRVWDLGGQTQIRPYWRFYYPHTNAIIFVVDSADAKRFDLCRKELMGMLEEEELKNSKLLVFANKQDMKDALPVAKLSQRLGLPLLKDRQWHICKSNALEGIGLKEGLDWLAAAINGKLS